MNETVIAKKASHIMSAHKNRKGTISTVICTVLMMVFVVASIIVSHNTLVDGAAAVSDGYESAFASEKEASYQALYNKYYDKAEADHHVANRASIYIGNIREMDKLEVLKVRDVEFVVNNSDDNSGNIISWLEVPGEGTFVVDLSAAEFVVDSERAHVSVRLPRPELTNVVIDYSNVNKLVFEDDMFNGSFQEGEDLARKQLGEGDLLIKKEFAANEHFYLNAEASAISSIQCLVRALNPEIDLTVDVEFYG